jgi:hypothetical protein
MGTPASVPCTSRQALTQLPCDSPQGVEKLIAFSNHGMTPATYTSFDTQRTVRLTILNPLHADPLCCGAREPHASRACRPHHQPALLGPPIVRGERLAASSSRTRAPPCAAGLHTAHTGGLRGAADAAHTAHDSPGGRLAHGARGAGADQLCGWLLVNGPCCCVSCGLCV